MKGKLLAFLLPVVYVFALLLIVSPSGVSAVSEEEPVLDVCTPITCGTTEGTMKVREYKEECTTTCSTVSFSANRLVCPAGYSSHSDKCRKWVESGEWKWDNKHRRWYWDDDSHYIYANKITETFGPISVEYGLKSNDPNNCHKPTPESLNIPSWARGDYGKLVNELGSTTTCEDVFTGNYLTKSCTVSEEEIIPCEGTCPTSCGYEGGEVPDGNGGWKTCLPTLACPVDDEEDVESEEDTPEVKGTSTTTVVKANTGASDSSWIYIVEGGLILSTILSSVIYVKKYLA